MSLSASVEIVFGLDRVLVKIEFRGGGWSGQIIVVGVGGGYVHYLSKALGQ